MTADARLNRVFPQLTAKERALLVLRAMKTGEDEDPWVRRAMPWEQAPEFNRYMGLLNAVNTDLAAVLFVIREQVRQVELRESWLMTMHLAGLELRALRSFIGVNLTEPVTESEYAQRLEVARREFLPLAECAEIAAESYEGWTDDDREGDGVTDAAWERVCGARRAELARLARDGVIPSKGRGRRLRLQQGAFYDWLDEPVPVMSESGHELEIVPDDRAEEVARRRAEQAWLLREVQGTPLHFAVPLDADAPVDASVEPDEHDPNRFQRALLFAIVRDISLRSTELRAIEVAVAEVSHEFDGEDVFAPDLRATLDEAKASLLEVADEVRPYVCAVDTPEPEQDAVALVRRLVHRCGD